MMLLFYAGIKGTLVVVASVVVVLLLLLCL